MLLSRKENEMNVYYQDSVIPKKAGLAMLSYEEVEEPSRKKENILIPNKNHSLYQLTAGFEQFLLIKDQPETHDSRYTKPYKAWFGGTDEMPFLVRLRNECNDDGYCYDWPTVWRKNSFFGMITPRPIIYAEKKGIKIRRQGDIFAAKYPIQDWDILRFIRNSSSNFECGPDETKNLDARCLALFGTRHVLKGHYIKQSDHYSNVKNYYDIVCKGTIEAPDHDVLDLKELHGLWQTRNLFEPEKAD